MKKRKSKKRSAASSNWQREEPVLFLDRNLGKHVIADRLRAEGMAVEVHDDHLPPDAPDEDWLAYVGRRGWIALTNDKNIRYRTAELTAIRKHGVRIIVIRAKNATAVDMAEMVVKGRRRIADFAEKPSGSLVAAMYANGMLRPYGI